MRLILLRHGLTNDNVRGVAQGGTDTPLNEEGKRQAHHVAQNLLGTSVPFIVTSQLQRSQETGRIIADSLGVPLTISEVSLNETSFGIYEQKPYTELSRARQQNLNNIYHWKPPEGESPAEATMRVKPLVEKWLSHDTVLAIGHGGINRVLRALLLGEEYNLEHRQRNCCINEFHGDAIGKFTLLKWDHIVPGLHG
jgi:probable phosphoglycerate mutase